MRNPCPTCGRHVGPNDFDVLDQCICRGLTGKPTPDLGTAIHFLVHHHKATPHTCNGTKGDPLGQRCVPCCLDRVLASIPVTPEPFGAWLGVTRPDLDCRLRPCEH